MSRSRLVEPRQPRRRVVTADGTGVGYLPEYLIVW